jgi:hypothetical protein
MVVEFRMHPKEATLLTSFDVHNAEPFFEGNC